MGNTRSNVSIERVKERGVNQTNVYIFFSKI
jgi:hypothetical protein